MQDSEKVAEIKRRIEERKLEIAAIETARDASIAAIHALLIELREQMRLEYTFGIRSEADPEEV
jgi:hypothetical protein